MAPPPARTPFSVSNFRFVSNSQTTLPSFVECARSAPSFDPENRTPGMSVGAEMSAALQPVPPSHFSGKGGTYHARNLPRRHGSSRSRARRSPRHRGLEA
jgi:hypothetical protein